MLIGLENPTEGWPGILISFHCAGRLNLEVELAQIKTGILKVFIKVFEIYAELSYFTTKEPVASQL